MDDGQLLVAVAKEYLYAVGILSLCLQQVAVGLRLLECRQHDVIRIEVHVVHLLDAIDVQFVAPNGVLAHIRLDGGLIGVVREGNHLTLLRELIITISILQGIDTVFSVCNALDDKMSVGICTCYTQ